MVRSHLCLLATQCGWCGCEANSSSSNSMAIHLGAHTSKHHELSCELHFGLRIRTDFMDHWHEITVSFMRQNHNAIEHGTVIVSIVGPVIPDSASSLWHWDSLCSTRLPSMLHHNEKCWERTAPCWGFLVRIKFWDADSLFMYRFMSQLMLCCATCCHFHVCATFSPVSWGILQRLINTSQFTKLCRQGEPVSCLCHWPFDSVLQTTRTRIWKIGTTSRWYIITAKTSLFSFPDFQLCSKPFPADMPRQRLSRSFFTSTQIQKYSWITQWYSCHLNFLISSQQGCNLN